jgi:acyl-CoA synthetase (NDP forming)
MSTYRLDKLFSPRSVSVVGASPRETSPGRAVLRNLRSVGFKGSISLVNPRYGEIEGIKAVKTIQELREAPDLLVIATPPESISVGDKIDVDFGDLLDFFALDGTTRAILLYIETQTAGLSGLFFLPRYFSPAALAD